MNENDFFNEVIYAYTRKQAIEDGFQVIADEKLTKEAGFKYPVYINRTVWDRCVELPKNYGGCQSITGRLWDILTMLRFAIRKVNGDTVNFIVSVSHRNYTLQAKIGATDIDNPIPAITIMFPGED